ncbi:MULTISPECIES: PTS sugar transporter subunit IIA [Anaerococcus]|uniref:PTS sugar transporter subunit IIA n=1 Tax=Anaerococcus TaxID=165779 RepID=UPI0012B3B3B3|nr:MULTISPECIES: PTS sugar transporter subunit IIA [Anaerococcus]MDY3005823.1 PTS sugar transporter subunit IIA [Anaerococcus porci]
MENQIEIREDLIFLNCKFKDRDELLKFMSDKMMESDKVNKTFFDAVRERELKYPTGLNTGEIKVAIPHTDPKHVKSAAIAVATLSNKVEFKNMEDPNENIGVDLVFMLAVADPKSQVPLLVKLMSIFSDKELLKKIKNSKSGNEIKEELENLIKE